MTEFFPNKKTLFKFSEAGGGRRQLLEDEMQM
jgi:hypothetical protein